MLDCIYHMTLKNFEMAFFGVKFYGFAIKTQRYSSHYTTLPKSVNHSLSILTLDVISLPDLKTYDKL